MNPDYQKGNGLSVMMAEEVIGNENFILSMSDHVVTPLAIRRVVNSEETKNLLLVDKQVERIFDEEDATKVYCQDNRILNINKNLTEYNGIDCGIFRLTSRFFLTMRAKMERGKDSISSGVEELIRNDDMLAIFMEHDERWIDIDTPQAYQFALKMGF
jgi:choline kinase